MCAGPNLTCQSIQESVVVLVFDLILASSVGFFRANLLYFYFGCVVFLVSLLQTMAGVRIDALGQMTRHPRFSHVRMLGFFVSLELLLIVLIPISILLMPQDLGPVGLMTQYFISLSVMQVNLIAQMALYYCEWRAIQLDEPWEEKSRYVFYIEFARDVAMLLTYPLCVVFSLFVVPWSKFLFVPLGTLRQFMLLMFSVYKKTMQYLRFSAATRDMDNKYPALTENEVEQMSDKTCIICREEFDANARSKADTPRRLPCSHVFHFRCLHSWLERQQNCPTCRRDVLDTQTQTQTQRPQHTQSEQEQVRAQHSAQAQPESETPAQPTPLAMLLERLSQRPDASTQLPQDTLSHASQLSVHNDNARDNDNDNNETKSEAEDPREVVRRAALRRFGQWDDKSTARPEQVPSPSSPVLIPLFDPLSVPDFATRIAPALPHPVVDWAMPQKSQASMPPLSFEHLSNVTDTQLRNRLQVLQNTKNTLEHAIREIQEALAPSVPQSVADEQQDKGKAPAVE